MLPSKLQSRSKPNDDDSLLFRNFLKDVNTGGRGGDDDARL